MAYLFIFCTVVLTAYGQLVLKWKVSEQGSLFSANLDFKSLVLFLMNPWVMSAFAAAFGASITWMFAIQRLPLSKAYPFMAINFPLVAVLAVFLFNEQLTTFKMAGIAFIILGVLLMARSTT